MSRSVACENFILTATLPSFIYYYNKMPQPNYTENLLKFLKRSFDLYINKMT